MEIKKHSCQIAVFFINLLVLVLVVLGIKEKEAAKISVETKREDKVVPVDSSMLETQNRLASSRENKLRDLNSSPKSIKQENVTTTITVAPDKKSTSTSTTKAADTKTKTS